MNRGLTITVSAYDPSTGVTIDRNFLVDGMMMYDAMQPIRHNDEGCFYDMQSSEDNRKIQSKRNGIAKQISHELTNFIVNKVFSTNDTLNGYKIRGDEI